MMDIKETIKALEEKNVLQPCPRCLAKKFSIAGESEIPIKKYPSRKGFGARGILASTNVTKTTIPTTVITCDNCGYVAQHALASLDLLPQPLGGFGARGILGGSSDR